MKKIVVFDEYNEIDLRPFDLLKRYIQLTEKDVKDFFPKQGLKESPCPGCRGKNGKTEFAKFGMQYVECADCSTLYVSPRPDDAALNGYYTKSAARNYWHDELSKKTNRKRQDKIIRPRFDWILDSTQEYLPDAEHIVDINTEQYGYIDELMDNTFFKRKTLLNPCVRLDNGALNGRINILNVPLDSPSLKNNADVVSIFEVADRTGDVDAFFAALKGMMKKNGLCFMTDILISGFDLQTLWDKADNIFPPDRLNIFTVEGLRALFQRHDFECLEFSTPGILDVELVETAVQHNPQIKLSKPVDYMLRNRSAESKILFQEFLQENLLSSYARIVLRKK
jgi:hypothetical protein